VTGINMVSASLPVPRYAVRRVNKRKLAQWVQYAIFMVRNGYRGVGAEVVCCIACKQEQAAALAKLPPYSVQQSEHRARSGAGTVADWWPRRDLD